MAWRRWWTESLQAYFSLFEQGAYSYCKNRKAEDACPQAPWQLRVSYSLGSAHEMASHEMYVKLSKWEERPGCWLVWMVAVLLIHGSQPRQLVQEVTIWQKLPGGFPGSSAGKESACQAGDPGSIPELGRSPGGGIAHSFQHSWACLVAQMVKNLPAMLGAWVRSQGWEDLEKRHGHPLQYSCLENFHRGTGWATYSPWGCKESHTTERLSTEQRQVPEPWTEVRLSRARAVAID